MKYFNVYKISIFILLFSGFTQAAVYKNTTIELTRSQQCQTVYLNLDTGVGKYAKSVAAELTGSDSDLEHVRMFYTNREWQITHQGLANEWYESPYVRMKGDLSGLIKTLHTIKVCSDHYPVTSPRKLKLSIFDSSSENTQPLKAYGGGAKLESKFTTINKVEGSRADNEYKPTTKIINGKNIIDRTKYEEININKVDTILNIKGSLINNADQDIFMIKLPNKDVKTTITIDKQQQYGDFHSSDFLISNTTDGDTGSSEFYDNMKILSVDNNKEDSISGLYKANSYLTIFVDAFNVSRAPYNIRIAFEGVATTRSSRTLLSFDYGDNGTTATTSQKNKVKQLLQAPKSYTSSISKSNTVKKSDTGSVDTNGGHISSLAPEIVFDKANGSRESGTLQGYSNSVGDLDTYRVFLNPGERFVIYSSFVGDKPTKVGVNADFIMLYTGSGNAYQDMNGVKYSYHITATVNYQQTNDGNRLSTFAVDAKSIYHAGWYYLRVVGAGSGSYKLNYFKDLPGETSEKIVIPKGSGIMGINRSSSWVLNKAKMQYVFDLPENSKFTLYAAFEANNRSNYSLKLVDKNNNIVMNSTHGHGRVFISKTFTNLKAGTYKLLSSTIYNRAWLMLGGSYTPKTAPVAKSVVLPVKNTVDSEKIRAIMTILDK
jgi:hypothetical protein